MVPILEHILIVSTFLLPPVAILISLVVCLALFGKTLGLRESYVNTLIFIFEWAARQIKTTERNKRRESTFPSTDEVVSSGDEDESEKENEADENKPAEEGLRHRHGSGSSLSSLSSICSKRSRRGSESSALGIIRRETQIHLDDDEDEDFHEILVKSRGWAVVRDSIDFVKAGIEAVIEDEVTSRFEAEQLVTWNMLTRTSIRFYQFVNWKLTTLYIIGLMFRYCIMLPMRFVLFGMGLIFLIVSTGIIGMVSDGPLKRKLNHHCMLISNRILSRCLTGVVYFHDTHNRARNGGICVANHTSPIDAMILSTDNVYALIGQRHGGLLGIVQRALSRASSHIWFERNEAKDRSTVTKRLFEHCNDPHKLPVLIFPEGTCINNTSVMMFKKGSFEVGTTIYPIAMKYDSRFGDAFWNSSEQSWFEYIMRMMTSWAIICNVWYLPAMTKLPEEDAVDFANRVKKEIARKGGLVDLEWDGQLKRTKVPKKLVAKQQEKYAHRMSRYTSTSVDASKFGIENNEEDDEDYVSFLSPTTLENLPEDAVVSDEEEEEEEEEEDEALSSPTGNPLSDAPISDLNTGLHMRNPVTTHEN
ncbi:unnamed protein product [Auanema sp. JU1783]|nr:unnamed protein product [Auanema sp. JU1783]